MLVPAVGPEVNIVVVRVLVITVGCETMLPLELVIVEVVSEVMLDELVVLVDDIIVDKDVLLVVANC
jgi:hypothetical protein